MKHRFKFLAWTLVASLVSPGNSQSFNVDLDFPGFPALGAGVPQNSFGGGASQIGHWSALSASFGSARFLTGLDGNLTSVRIEPAIGGGSGGGQNNLGTTGDFRALLNDARTINTQGDNYKISGLINGHYVFYNYAASLTTLTQQRRTSVTVTQAISNPTQIVTGPIQGDQFILGVHYSRHELLVTNGEINFTLQSLYLSNNWWNGFQLKYVVPEPSSLLALSSFAFMLFKGKRRVRHSLKE